VRLKLGLRLFQVLSGVRVIIVWWNIYFPSAEYIRENKEGRYRLSKNKEEP